MTSDSWEPLDYEPAWSKFDHAYGFRPGMNPTTWPAIAEPPGSVTIDLRPIFTEEGSSFVAGESAVNALVHRALTQVLPSDAALTVLDWQHQCFRFWPHRGLITANAWPISPFPNGDYFIFLTDDTNAGTFGHPWEQSLCIFGPLVEVLAPMLTSWLPVRRDARAPGESS